MMRELIFSMVFVAMVIGPVFLIMRTHAAKGRN